ncbi:MAG: hypothetical protein Q8S15_08120 [Erysipelotrichaceae bacterium]|nr:hypothetical protein [Erysipelotrichaceae bacterium]MDP3306024.1 hypothetical protein [Erysipelotrichaceae bacterium]
MKKLLLIILMTLVFAGCSSNAETLNDYYFETNGLKISMGDKASDFLVKTGTPIEQYSAPSCAFDGDDTVYDFGSYQITTYLSVEGEIFTGVYLLDDRFSTKEGIKIGSKLSEMLSTYGDKYEENYGAYTYSLGLTELSFVVIDDVITSISYLHKVE